MSDETLEDDPIEAMIRSPRLFPFDVDPDWRTLQVLALEEADYRRESFLDLRLEGFGPWWKVAWPKVEAAVSGLPLRCHFIFHIGHVGSTLLSRLVGEHPALFSVREPHLLRVLAGMPGQQSPSASPTLAMSDSLLRLWGRTWRPQQTAVIKATSFVSEMAVDLMRRMPSSRAVLMFANPLAYLRGVMGGPATRLELHQCASARLARLHRRLNEAPWRNEDLSEGERVAMSWLSETAALAAAAAAYPDRTRWLNFDHFLDQPQVGLTAAWSALGADVEPDALTTLIEGPIMRRYSKAPEHAFDAEIRRQVMIQADGENGMEIRRGMAWLGDAATRFPLVRTVLETAARQHLASEPL